MCEFFWPRRSVLRDLGAGNDQHAVSLAARARASRPDVGEIGLEVLLAHAEARGGPSVASRPARASRSFFIRM